MILTTCIFLGKCFPGGNILIRILARLSGQYTGDIKTLPNFIIAFLFTVWFLRLNERHSKVINSLSKSVFSIYIVHQIPAFISFIWKRIFMADLWITDHQVWFVFVVYAVLLAVCSIIDLFRRKTVEPVVEKSKPCQKSLAYINTFFGCN